MKATKPNSETTEKEATRRCVTAFAPVATTNPCLRAYPVACFSAFLLLCCPILLTAGSSLQMIDEAVREYGDALNAGEHNLRTERFRRAQRLFHKVIEDTGVANADLYVNMGNAALQCEQMGQAVLAYRHALVIEPGHRRAHENLNYARHMLPDWVPRPQTRTLLDTFFFWHQTISRSGRNLMASLCFSAAAILMAIAIRWKRNWARNTAVLAVVVWAALTGLSLWERWHTTNNQAVITASQVVVRSADSIGAPPRFAEPLPAGTEVEVTDQRQSWAHVRLANGRDGWIRTSSFMLVSQ